MIHDRPTPAFLLPIAGGVWLALSSVADPDPPGVVTALIGTHPPTIDRIGAAVAYARETGVTASR